MVVAKYDCSHNLSPPSTSMASPTSSTPTAMPRSAASSSMGSNSVNSSHPTMDGIQSTPRGPTHEVSCDPSDGPIWIHPPPTCPTRLSTALLGGGGVPKAAAKALMIRLGATAGGIREGTPKFAATLVMASRPPMLSGLMSLCVGIVVMMIVSMAFESIDSSFYIILYGTYSLGQCQS